jgi:hypothetical protein
MSRNMIQIAVVNEPLLLKHNVIPNQIDEKLKQELIKKNSSKTKVYCCLITLLFYLLILYFT